MRKTANEPIIWLTGFHRKHKCFVCNHLEATRHITIELDEPGIDPEAYSKITISSCDRCQDLEAEQMFILMLRQPEKEE